MKKLIILVLFLFVIGCVVTLNMPEPTITDVGIQEMDKVKPTKTDAEWKATSEEEWKTLLTPEEYHILREKGTEPSFSGDLLQSKEKGVYTCAACGRHLFSSDVKYDSKTGWPSFWEAVDSGAIVLREDNSFFMKRTEIICGRCGSHLGHLFLDGPAPTGKRYCINSLALDFEAQP